jgi:hypothetical protein
VTCDDPTAKGETMAQRRIRIGVVGAIVSGTNLAERALGNRAIR